MTNQFSLLAGALVGLSIAMPIGPMGLLCIQRTLTSGMAAGVSTGLGAATVNVAYGALILLGLGRLAPYVASSGRLFDAACGLFLLWSAARTLMRRRSVAARLSAAPSPLAAYGSAVAFNATNPMSLVMVMALLAPLAGLSAPAPADAAVLLLGMFLAAAAWWVCLSFMVAMLRARVSPAALVALNRVAGLALTVYGLVALAQAMTQSARMP